MNRWLGTITLICAGTARAHGDHAVAPTEHLVSHSLSLVVSVVVIGVVMVVRRRCRH